MELDSLELEPEDKRKLAALLEEPGWVVIHKMEVSLLQEHHNRLVSSRELVDVARAQGAIEALTRLHNWVVDTVKEEQVE